MIVLNSICLGLADYSHVNKAGDIVEEGSWQNVVLIRTEVVFTSVFTLECILKITALGFYGSPGAYLSDKWSWIDFIVVISG
jgi:hypothetical protein